MEERGRGDQLAAAARVLDQVQPMLAQDQDDDAMDLMRRVRRLEFEETSDGFRDATDGYAFYRAAVFFIEERDRPRFTEAALQRVLPRLAETARHNGTDHVDRIHLRLLRPEISDGPPPSYSATLVEVRRAQPPRPASASPAQSGTSAPERITQVTRRRLFDALREAGVTWSGTLDEVGFLRRLYDLDSLESTDRRFPTAEGDIVQHRCNNPDDWEDDWVFSDSRFQLDQGPDDVLLRFLAEMVHPEVRTDDQETEQLVHLFNTALARDGFRFTPVSTISGYPVYEALRLIPRPQQPPSAQSRESAAPAAGRDGYEEVRRQAHGDPKAYRREKFPHPDSNQADVFRATHKKTGIVVAMKQLRVRSTGGMRAARMKREIDAGIALAGHPHAMPILDHAAGHTWFVMPWAEKTAHDHRETLQDPQHVRDLVDALTSVLAEAHGLGWIHRDIKPANILRLNGQWVLADWGTVRRPAGQTTKVGRTSAGIGTAGFTAPELFQDQEQDLRPQPSSDIYSIGRVIAWALTGQVPRTNMPLLPEQPGPWRNIVRAATQTDPQRRPQTIDALLTLIEREHAEVPEDHVDLVDRATKLVAAANSGDPAAGDAFLTLLTDHGHDYGLHVGVLTRLAVKRSGQALVRDQTRAQSILRALAEHVDGDGTRVVQFAEAATVVIWLQGLAAYAAGRHDWDLLEEALQTMCIWDGAWNQWRAQDKVGPWLASLKEDAATAVAAVLRDHPDSARHFSGLADNPAVDPRIRQAVRNA